MISQFYSIKSKSNVSLLNRKIQREDRESSIAKQQKVGKL